MVPPFPPFLVGISETYGIRAIHLHPKSVALLAVFAYACEAWVGIKLLVAYFRHLFALRSSGQN
jgi:NADH:ubiquinone oxidoreductase subunit K